MNGWGHIGLKYLFFLEINFSFWISSSVFGYRWEKCVIFPILSSLLQKKEKGKKEVCKIHHLVLCHFKSIDNVLMQEKQYRQLFLRETRTPLQTRRRWFLLSLDKESISIWSQFYMRGWRFLFDLLYCKPILCYNRARERFFNHHDFIPFDISQVSLTYFWEFSFE